MADEEVAQLKEQLKQLKEEMAKQKSGYVQKIKDMEQRHLEDAAMTAGVDADDVQDAAEFEAQCDMLELSLSDKIDKLAAANATITELKGEVRGKEEANEELQQQLQLKNAELAAQKGKQDDILKELEATRDLTRQYKASLDKIRSQQETRLAELKRSHAHEMHQLHEKFNQDKDAWGAEMRAATDRLSQQKAAYKEKIANLQSELASRVAQVEELEKRIEYLENADHVAEMLAANQRYQAALAIIEKLKGQLELLHCRLAETEKLLTVEKRKAAGLQQQLAQAQQAAKDAASALTAAQSQLQRHQSTQPSTMGGASSSSLPSPAHRGSALNAFVGHTLQTTPRNSTTGGRRGLTGGANPVTSPREVRTSAAGGEEASRVQQVGVSASQAPDHLRTVHVQSGQVPPSPHDDNNSNSGGSAVGDSTPLQSVAATRAEVSFVQNLEHRLQKSRSDNVRLVEEVQKLKKQLANLEANKNAAVAQALREAAERKAKEAAAKQAAADAAVAAAREEAERERKRRQQEEERKRREEEEQRRQQELQNNLGGDPMTSMGVLTMQAPAAVALASDAKAAAAAAAHAKAAAEAAAVAKALIQFRGVQVSGPQAATALLMPPGLRITGDLAPGQGYDSSTLALTVSTAPGASNRPAQLTSPERVRAGGPRRYVAPRSPTSEVRKALATPPGLDVPGHLVSPLREEIETKSPAPSSKQEQVEDDEAFRARRRQKLWELVGSGM